MWFGRRISLFRLLATRNASSVTSAYKTGDRIHGYKVLRTTEVPELAISAVHLKHEKSAAEHLHLARDDDNNCFNVVFRTTPSDSTGVAHILEHLVLCGSQKFPCRDPFMKMTTRSLATFLNAMTWPDATQYPFSSYNRKDFTNLMEVYLDAVFFPKLRPLDFLQEAWRLGHENEEDKSSSLKLKGVVFNEMKGAFSNPGLIYYRGLLNRLFPDTTYCHESGGDPLHIPNLTHKKLLEFYSSHYHPSNARFMTYGNFPLESHLELINDRVLSKFDSNESIRKQSRVPLQSQWKDAQRAQISCAPDPFAPDPTKQTTISVSFLLSDISDVFHSFVLSFISSLLVSGPTSPFYESLIASGVGCDWSPGTGFLDFTRQSAFSVGVQGVTKEDMDKVEKIIHQTLEETAINGFPDEKLEALLHQIEISIKHVTSNFGLNLASALNPVLNHDVDAFTSLRTTEAVDRLRSELKADPEYLKKIIRKELLENKHRLVLLMSPDENYMQKLQMEEQELTQSIIKNLSPLEREKLSEKEQELLQFVHKEDDASVLPTLNVEKDISREFKGFTLNKHTVSDVPVQSSIQKTNGLNYLKLFLPTDVISDKLLPYLPIFANLVTKVGAGNKSYREMDLEIRLRTGGIASSLHSSDDKNNPGEYEKGILLSSSCLHRNDIHMYRLLEDILCAPLFGKELEHLKQLIRMTTTELANGIADAGHSYAISRASSHLLESAQFGENTTGLAHVLFMQKISQEKDLTDLLVKLDEIRSYFVARSNLRVSINTDSTSAEDRNINLLQKLLSAIPVNGKVNNEQIEKVHIDLDRIHREHHVLNINSNYVGKVVRTVPFNHPDYAPLQIAASLMSSKFLLREIREIGGAYGARATSRSNLFSFASYRDPNVDRTIEKFEESSEWLAGGTFKDEDISEAKLAVFQSIDKPIPPSNAGDLPFLQRISYEEKQRLRLHLLSVSRDDLVRVAKDHLMGREKGSAFAMLGPPNSKARLAWEQIEH